MSKEIFRLLQNYVGQKPFPKNFYKDLTDEEALRKEVNFFFEEGFKLGLKLGFECTSD